MRTPRHGWFEKACFNSIWPLIYVYMNKRLLLLSNSTNPGEAYLSWPKNHIKDFLGQSVKNVLFIPYAGVNIDEDDYIEAVSGAFTTLGYKVKSITQNEIRAGFLDAYDAVVVGGGNTFYLVTQLHRYQLIEPIRQAVERGMPFIGWSAGANIACPTIRTTNDMPIIEPPSFSALDLVPFQINPHYTEATLPNHGGESRMMRIQEFIKVNPDIPVIGLPEGSLLRYEKERMYYMGKKEGKIFIAGQDQLMCKDGDDLSWLLQYKP